MKRLFVAACVVLFMMACAQKTDESHIVNQSQNKNAMVKSEKEAIEKLLGEYKNALNTANAELAQSLYAKDGVFMPAGAPSAVGSDNILKSYEFIFTQIQLTIEFYIEEILVEGDVAFATTSSKGTTLIHATNETLPEENRELFVFEKADSEWKIARYMFNKTK